MAATSKPLPQMAVQVVAVAVLPTRRLAQARRGKATTAVLAIKAAAAAAARAALVLLAQPLRAVQAVWGPRGMA